MRIALVYIAGPFTAPDVWSTMENIHRAERLARQVVEIGALPVCPHSMGRSFIGVGDPELWYAGTLELMRRCDAALFAEDWSRSKGAREEMIAAEQRPRKAIFVERADGIHFEEMAQWLRFKDYDLLPSTNAAALRAHGFRDLMEGR